MNRNTVVMLGTVSAVLILFQAPPVLAGDICLDSFAEDGMEKMEINLDFYRKGMGAQTFQDLPKRGIRAVMKTSCLMRSAFP